MQASQNFVEIKCMFCGKDKGQYVDEADVKEIGDMWGKDEL